MMSHPQISILVVERNGFSINPFLSYLQSIGPIRLTIKPQLPQDLSLYDAVVTTDTPSVTEHQDLLQQFVQAGGGWLGLIDLSEKPLPGIFGAQATPAGPPAELRVIFQNRDHPLKKRLPEAIYVSGRYQALEKRSADTEVLLYADWHYQHSPVLVCRRAGKGHAACTTLQAYDHPDLQQILYRLLRHLSGQPIKNQTLGVGILGYSPFVGREHGLGVEATAGLKLRAICDLNPLRLGEARDHFPDLKTYCSAEDLKSDPEVDMVIICTPPNTHAEFSLRMMDAGKHVLCEKPLALNSKETEAMVALSEKARVHLSCHQNRRWDPDYLAIKQALKEGLVGDLFYMETFVGQFSHPCGYWHSHEAISGGTAYDWGSHYLDWVVSLIPDQAKSVIGTRHKRVWHDVTNADQERIQIRFAGGQEAEFLHSDIAAVRKPKWYLLGTEGAIVGHWQDVTEYVIDPILFFHQHDIPATEMPSVLTLERRHPSGRIISQKLAVPAREPYLLYRNLADHLLTGEPIEAPLEQSVMVVAILEAAARSASQGGCLERL